MATAPSATDIARVYATTDDVVPYLAPHTIGEGADNPITGERVAAVIRRFSREVDGLLAGHGWRTPFPAAGAVNPDTPEPVRAWVAIRTAAEAALWAAGGNRRSRQVANLMAAAFDVLRVEDGGLRGSLAHDAFIEYTAGENYQTSTDDGAGQEAGRIGQTYLYRLRNKGLVVDGMHPLTFTAASGSETFGSSGLPYDINRDWYVVDAGQSIIALANWGQITAQAPLVNYWWTWRDPTWGQARPPSVAGASHYVVP